MSYGPGEQDTHVKVQTGGQHLSEHSLSLFSAQVHLDVSSLPNKKYSKGEESEVWEAASGSRNHKRGEQAR